jgi:hypothetical protein
VRIDAGEDRRARDVARFVRDRFKGTDHLPQVRRRLEESLLAHVERADQEGALELYLSTEQVGGLPLSSSLVVTFLPGPGGAEVADGDLQEMLLAAAEEAGEDVVVDRRLVTWEGGWAVRRLVERAAPSGDDPLGRELGPAPTFGVEWFRPIPGTGGDSLLLAFSSPLLPVRDALTELFDTVAGSLVWT